jgi:hypothetical protein
MVVLLNNDGHLGIPLKPRLKLILAYKSNESARFNAFRSPQRRRHCALPTHRKMEHGPKLRYPGQK